ncbi:MAG TPA: hypothetical protein VIU62_12860, partial [Chloroflexota bacterium]
AMGSLSLPDVPTLTPNHSMRGLEQRAFADKRAIGVDAAKMRGYRQAPGGRTSATACCLSGLLVSRLNTE